MADDFSDLVNRTFSSSPRLSLHPLLAKRPSLLDIPQRHTEPTVPGASTRPPPSSHSHTDSEPKSSASIASTMTSMTSMTSASSRRLSFELIAPPMLQPNPLSSHPVVSSAPSSARQSPKPPSTGIPSFPVPPSSAKTLPMLPTSKFSPSASPIPKTPQPQSRSPGPPPQPQSKPPPPPPGAQKPPQPQSSQKPPPQQQRQQQQSRPDSQPFVHSIHRNFDAYSSPRFRACEALSASLGYPCRCDVNWTSLYSKLSPFYRSDIALLPVEVSLVVEAFAHALGSLVDDTTGITDDGWNSRFFETIRPAGVVKIFVSVRDPVEGESPGAAAAGITVEHSAERRGFVIWVPKAAIAQKLEHLVPILMTEVCALFHLGGCEDSGVADGLDYLPTPEDLFTHHLQYIIVRDEVGEVTIEGSHSESLELLASWFQKYVRVNEGDSLKRPHFDVEMHYSSWGHGDSRRLERIALRRTNKLFHASVTSVLVVVEGVAGYSRINIQGNSYLFEKQC